MIPYQQDPIFVFQKVHENPWILFDTTKKLNRQIRESFPEKKLLDQWADGLPFDKFFSGNYSNTLVITNNVITCTQEQSRHIHTVANTYYGQYYFDYPELDVLITKEYNCFSHRFDLSRQGWFYQLIRNKILDQGFVSFHCDSSRIPSQDYAGLSPKEMFELGFQKSNSIFEDEHEQIKNHIPFQNFVDTGDLTHWVLASKFSIVLETHFHNNRVKTFSEKIFRCLQLPRPWVVYTAQGGVQYLRDIGFDVLDDIVDHSYDLIADPIHRQIAMLEQIKMLIGRDISISRCKQASQHNKNLLCQLHKNWWVNMRKEFDIAVQKLIAL